MSAQALKSLETKSFHLSFWPPGSSLPSHQGRHKQLFREAVVPHSGQVTQKAKSSLGEDGGNTLLLGQLTNGGVSLHVSDGYTENDPEAAYLEAFQAMDLWFKQDCTL